MVTIVTNIYLSYTLYITNVPQCGAQVVAEEGPLKYALTVFLTSIAPFEDRLNDLLLTFVLV